jgi:hypothetical protein
LICNDREPEFVGVKIERAILIAHWNANELDLLNHDVPNLNGSACWRPELTTLARKKLLSF